MERRLDDGTYEPGPWAAFLERAERSPAEDRAAIAEDVTRVGDKLHRRNHPGRKVSVKVGVLLETMMALDGVATVYLAVRWDSGVWLAVGAFFLSYTLQVLWKMLVGTLLGVRYSYFYRDFVVEARVKMRYGSYLRASRASRVALHLAGTMGSPMALFGVAAFVRSTMPTGARICDIVGGFLCIVQVVLFLMPIVGIRKVGSVTTDRSSGGAAARELKNMMRRAA